VFWGASLVGKFGDFNELSGFRHGDLVVKTFGLHGDFIGRIWTLHGDPAGGKW
jgi:hypothetical protein